MKILAEKAKLDCSATYLWSILSDVGRCDWVPTIEKITLDGDSSENDHANVTLGASNIEYGPYSVTSQADISDGAYSVTVAIYSKDVCNVASATGSALSLHEGCDFSAVAVRQTGAQTRV